MNQKVLDEVAFLFVEQYEKLHTKNYKRQDVRIIRESAQKGIQVMYTVVATLFGDYLDSALIGTAYGAMDYIAYVDETWMPKDTAEKAAMLELQKLHLDSLEIILYMAGMNQGGAVKEVKEIQKLAKRHYQRLTHY